MSDAPPAAVLKADTEGFFLLVKAPTQLKAMLSLTHSPKLSLTDLTTSYIASFLTVPPLTDFSLPMQEEANISSQSTNKFASLNKYLNENKKPISTTAKNDLVLHGKPIPDTHFPGLLRSLYKKNRSMNFNGLAEFESNLRQLHATPTLVSLKDAVTALCRQKYKPGSSRQIQGNGLSYKHKSLSLSCCPHGKKLRFLHAFQM